MGLDFGLDSGQYCKRKFRWLMKVPNVAGEKGATCLPPYKSARPSLKFKEMEARHLNEDVFYATKPDWTPVPLTLYDLDTNQHPVFEWIKEFYEINDTGRVTLHEPTHAQFMKQVRLELYNGCGKIVEAWIFEDAWPQSANFSDLDMGNHDICVCDLTLRFARAYIKK